MPLIKELISLLVVLLFICPSLLILSYPLILITHSLCYPISN